MRGNTFDYLFLLLALVVGLLLGAFVWLADQPDAQPTSQQLLDQNREWLGQAQNGTYSGSMWHEVSAALPDEADYVVQALQAPLAINAESYADQIVRICDAVPRWDSALFLARPELELHKTYLSLLKNLRSEVQGRALADYRSAPPREVRSELGTVRKMPCVANGLKDWLAVGSGAEPVTVKALGEGRLPRERWTAVDLGVTRLFPLSGLEPIDESSDQVDFQARRMSLFWLERGAWFDRVVLERAFEPSSFSPASTADEPEAEFWGPDGILGMIPVGVVVVDTPSVTFSVPAKGAAEFARWDKARQDVGDPAVGNVLIRSEEDRWILLAEDDQDSKISLRIIPNMETAWISAVISMPTPGRGL